MMMISGHVMTGLLSSCNCVLKSSAANCFLKHAHSVDWIVNRKPLLFSWEFQRNFNAFFISGFFHHFFVKLSTCTCIGHEFIKHYKLAFCAKIRSVLAQNHHIMFHWSKKVWKVIATVLAKLVHANRRDREVSTTKWKLQCGIISSIAFPKTYWLSYDQIVKMHVSFYSRKFDHV